MGRLIRARVTPIAPLLASLRRTLAYAADAPKAEKSKEKTSNKKVPLDEERWGGDAPAFDKEVHPEVSRFLAVLAQCD